jgi:hypothetical protein
MGQNAVNPTEATTVDSRSDVVGSVIDQLLAMVSHAP